MTEDRTLTAAQRRVRDEVLGWGVQRPMVPSGLVADLRRTLARSVATGLPQRGDGRGRQRVSAAALARPPGGRPPAGHDAATVRGLLLTAAVADDLAGAHEGAVAAVVDRAVDDLATARPGDPASPSAWWNAAEPAQRERIRDEVGTICADLRAMWPPLDPAQVHLSVRPRRTAEVPGRQVVLEARPLVVLDSPRRDDRARGVLLVARTGMPRPGEDRLLARITAVIETLHTGRPPFRWGVLHVTDGRLEVEELDADVLLAAAATAGARVGTVLDGAPARGRGPGHSGRR